MDAAIQTARSLGMPRLAAHLTRMKAHALSEAPEKGPVPAPEQSKELTGSESAAPGPDGQDVSDDYSPYFKGKPLARTEADEKLYARMKADQEQAKAEGKAAPLTFPIIYLDQLYNINDLEADEIFSKGTAEIPSDIAANHFAYCNQDTTLTLSWEKPTNWPRVDWPEADQIFNDVARAFWHGKWFVTDPVTKERKLFNIVFLDDAVGFIAGLDYVDPGFHPDHKPSFVVNYSAGEITLLKAGLDEFRRVGPTIFLGSGVAYIDLHKFLAQYPQPWTQALLTTFAPIIDVANYALTTTDNAVRAVRNMSEFTNLRYPPEQFLPFSFYFAVDCQDYRTPPMHYIPIVADGLTYFNNFWGWNPPNYELPSIPAEFSDTKWGHPGTTKFQAPPFKPSGSASAFPPDPNNPLTGIKFNTSAGTIDPFVLLPYTMPANRTSGTEEMQGFLQLPSKMVQPLFQNFWSSEQPAKSAVKTEAEDVAPAPALKAPKAKKASREAAPGVETAVPKETDKASREAAPADEAAVPRETDKAAREEAPLDAAPAPREAKKVAPHAAPAPDNGEE
eukprot:jgi/Botrbrau1/17625/Bobra.0166s0059.1